MSSDPDAPEYATYARERNESMRHVPHPHVFDERWNGTNWSERPDPSEYEEGR